MVEFVLVGLLLTVLTLGVLQLGFALLVRNTLIDAAAEGARFAGLAGNDTGDGVDRTRDLIEAALGPTYAQGVSGQTTTHLGYPATEIRVLSPLPLLGPIGLASGLEVTGHASIEIVD